MFTDDTFTLIPQRVKEICAGLKKLKETYKFTWYCEGHIHMLYKNPEMIDYMADAGILRIQLGIESGNQDVLNAYNKGCTVEEIEAVVKHCVDVGIEQILGNIILGSALADGNTYEKDLAFGERLIRLGQGALELGVVSYWPLAETAITDNPERYKLKIIDDQFVTASEDFPQVETDSLNRFDIVEMIQKMRSHFLKCMQDMISNDEIPLKRILKWFWQIENFKIASAWAKVLYSMPHQFAYYQMLQSGEVYRSVDLDRKAYFRAHPMRVVELNENIVVKNGKKFDLKECELNELDQKVLIYSVGKLSVTDVADRLKEDWPHLSITLENVIATLQKLERKHIIVYSMY